MFSMPLRRTYRLCLRDRAGPERRHDEIMPCDQARSS
jgi:hypothetical protein